MAKDKLAIDERRGSTWTIGWFLAEEGDFGLMLGRESGHSDDSTTAALNAIRGMPKELQPESLSESEWRWAELSAARKALRVAKEAVRLYAANRPMPEWAIKAMAEGWKAPNGWKP
jgi:hypothetical protein